MYKDIEQISDDFETDNKIVNATQNVNTEFSPKY